MTVGCLWPPRPAVVSVVLLALALTGCGGVETLSYPTPPATSRTTVVSGPTLPANLPSVIEVQVPGSTTTTAPAIGPGKATLNGTVLGPSGPIAGATVEADRLVGDQVATTETTTAADGSWTIGSILGGRYRVRAWQSPSLAVTSPQIFFLGSTQSESMTIQLTSFTGPNIASVISPTAPVVGQMDNLVVQATNPTVGSDGVVRNLPEVGVSITLTNGPEWEVYNGNPLATGANGEVLFQVSCQASGASPLSAAVGSGAPVSLQLPACVSAPTTTTTSTSTTNPCVTIPGGPSELSTTTSTTLFYAVC